MKQNFVTFLSPGTFVSEQTTEKVDSWDVDIAIEMYKDINERYGATPYGFYFSTKERGENDLDSHQSNRSGMYYLGGTIYTLSEIEAKNDPNDKILILNMKGNGWDKVIENNNSWKITQPLNKEDVVLEIQ